MPSVSKHAQAREEKFLLYHGNHTQLSGELACALSSSCQPTDAPILQQRDQSPSSTSSASDSDPSRCAEARKAQPNCAVQQFAGKTEAIPQQNASVHSARQPVRAKRENRSPAAKPRQKSNVDASKPRQRPNKNAPKSQQDFGASNFGASNRNAKADAPGSSSAYACGNQAETQTASLLRAKPRCRRTQQLGYKRGQPGRKRRQLGRRRTRQLGYECRQPGRKRGRLTAPREHPPQGSAPQSPRRSTRKRLSADP